MQQEQVYYHPSPTQPTQQPLEHALGPARAWDTVRESYLPYNIRNYQDRLVIYLKRVQEFGVQSY